VLPSVPPSPPSIADLREVEPNGRKWVLSLETWGLSTLFHLILFLVLGLTWTAVVKPRGDAPELLRTVELVTRREANEAPTQPTTSDTQATTATRSAAPGPIDVAGLLGGVQSPVDLNAALPKAAEVAGLGLGTDRPMLGGGGMLSGPAAKTEVRGGLGRTSVYGLNGEGFKFVYVFDRSGSMGGSGNRALNAAKAELLRSLADLGETHQFQIIFYNEEPSIMRLGGVANLMFANAQNKREAERFVQSITADGATQHEPALTAALRLSPDVVFFLTDADQPELSAAQLDRIKRLNGGRAVINTIEFGLGPKIRKHNFLDVVAAENGGRSAYVDISGR
jgi:hypothetical protein